MSQHRLSERARAAKRKRLTIVLLVTLLVAGFVCYLCFVEIYARYGLGGRIAASVFISFLVSIGLLNWLLPEPTLICPSCGKVAPQPETPDEEGSCITEVRCKRCGRTWMLEIKTTIIRT